MALASARARISLERRILSPPNLDCPFPTSYGTRCACRLLWATLGNGRYFADIRVLKKYAHSRLPVYNRRRAAVFNAPVSRNASNVFEETTFNGTVEMAKVGIRYIRGTDYSGKYFTGLARRNYRCQVRYICSLQRDCRNAFNGINNPINGIFETGHVSNRCQVRYTCSSQRQQRSSRNCFNQSLIQSTGFLETAMERDITMNENSVWLLLNGKSTYTTAN